MIRRLVYGSVLVISFTATLYVGVQLVGYPVAPARPAVWAGSGFRFEHGQQHVVHLQGDPYALGYYNAHLLAPLMHQQEEALVDALFAFTHGPFRALLVRQLSLAYLAGLDRYLTENERLEILGLADGAPDGFRELGPRYARLASYHALHELSQRFAFDNPLFACTLVAVAGVRGRDGHTYLARNFDFEGGDAFDRDKVVLAVQRNNAYGFVSVSWAGMAGVVSGMNERGLAIVINAGASSDYNRVGAPTTLLVRRALENAETIEQAVAIMTSAPRFVTDIIGLAERGGRVAVLELTPNHYALRQGEVLGATNHLETPMFAHDPTNSERLGQTTTVPRRQRLTVLLQSHSSPFGPEDLLTILRDKRAADGSLLPPGHRHALDAFIATHSTIFDTTSGVVWVSAGPQAAGVYHGYDVATLLAAQNPHEAEAAFRADLPADPDGAPAAFVPAGRAAWQTARRALQTHDLAAAERALAAVPDGLGGHPTTLALSGDLAMAEANPERAITLWRRALAIPPEYPIEIKTLRTKIEQAAQVATPHEEKQQ